MLEAVSADSIRQGVFEEIGRLLEDRGKSTEVRENMTLNGELALSSLDMAELVTMLEQRFGVDPFRQSVAITSIRTAGDLCRAYQALAPESEQAAQEAAPAPERSVPTMKGRLRGLRDKLNATYADTFLSFGTPELEEALEEVGVGAGDTIMVHSSFDQFAGFQEGPTEIVALLQKMVGPTGTILMPQQPTGGNSIDWAESGKIFDVANTPTQMGLLPEIFRRMPGVTRSLHPTHSVAAWGARAAEMLAGHEQTESPCGFGSPYVRLHEVGGKILHLGSPFETTTFVHAADELLRDRMPFSPLTEKVYTIKFLDWDGRERETHQKLFDRKYRQVRHIERLLPPLRGRGLLHETSVSRVNIILVEVQPMVKAMGELADTGFYYYDIAALG